MRSAAVCLAAALAAWSSVPSFANELAVVERLSGSSAAFALDGAYANITLTVSGPDGFHARRFVKRGSGVAMDLSRLGPLSDGTYTYQLTAATGQKARIATPANDGRARRASAALRGIAASGSFLVKGGAVVAKLAKAANSNNDRD